MRIAVGLLCAVSLVAQSNSIVAQVKAEAMVGRIQAAASLAASYRAASGVTPEYLEAYSWIGRAERNLTAADDNATEVRKLALDLLKTRRLDAEPHLPIALGASIEVHAGVLAKQSQRDQAVVFLQGEIRRWAGTSIVMRLQKNLNLLTLEGKPVPALDLTEAVGARKPQSLAAYRGHPVLMFLWAHWCPDCKNEVAIVHQLQQTYGPKGLVVIAPTQRYGYVAHGDEAPPAVENQYIQSIWDQFYAPLGAVDIPLASANFQRFGVSTTPTMLIVDSRGIVQLYFPGAAPYETLVAKLDPLFNSVVTSTPKAASH